MKYSLVRLTALLISFSIASIACDRACGVSGVE